MELDHLDRLAEEAFPGYIVRKDLALRFRGQYPVPTYVGEFLIGRYCATTDEDEITEGLAIVERQMRERTVRPGEEELFKSAYLVTIPKGFNVCSNKEIEFPNKFFEIIIFFPALPIVRNKEEIAAIPDERAVAENAPDTFFILSSNPGSAFIRLET